LIFWHHQGVMVTSSSTSGPTYHHPTPSAGRIMEGGPAKGGARRSKRGDHGLVSGIWWDKTIKDHGEWQSEDTSNVRVCYQWSCCCVGVVVSRLVFIGDDCMGAGGCA
jgi:hypothetical protein